MRIAKSNWLLVVAIGAGCGGAATGTNPSLLRVEGVAAGADCAFGGSAILAGVDLDADGTLDDAEVQLRSFACNGADGSVGPAGTSGANGANGIPGATGPTGPIGPAGDAGENGLTTLLTVTPEGTTGQCSNGGVRIDTGVDLDRDSALDANEITATEYVCATGASDVLGFRLVSRYQAPTGPAAEIVTATPDGRRVVFTNGIDNTVDVLDITTAANPTLVGSVSVRDVVGHAGKGAVTSVAVTPNGRFAVAAVLDSNDPSAANAGSLAFIDLGNLAAGVVGQVALGVGPDSVHVTPDGLRVVVAIEDEGPSARSGSIQTVTIDYANPSASTVKTLALAPSVGNTLSDLQPEFVDVSKDGTRAIVSLQENNLVAVLDLTNDTVVRYIDLGSTSHTADVTANGTVDLTAAFTGRREADSVCFLADGQHFVTANEGDTSTTGGVFSGGRGYSVFDLTGTLVYESGESVGGMNRDSRAARGRRET